MKALPLFLPLVLFAAPVFAQCKANQITVETHEGPLIFPSR